MRPSSTYPLARAIVGDQGPVMNSMAFSAASSANLGHNIIITHLELNDQLEHVLNLSPPSSSLASSLLSIQISDKPRMGIMLHLPWMITACSILQLGNIVTSFTTYPIPEMKDREMN